MINFDNAASTPPLPEVSKAAARFLETYGSVHRGAGEFSRTSTETYEQARREIRAFVGGRSSDYVVFCGNTTGGMNLLATLLSDERGVVAFGALEHSSSRLPWILAEGRRRSLGRPEEVMRAGNRAVVEYPVDNRLRFGPKQVASVLNPGVKAVVLTAGSNLTGFCPNLPDICRRIRVEAPQCWIVVDACQLLAHHEFDLHRVGADFVVGSGHKMFAPYGEGFVAGPGRFFDARLPHIIGGGNLPYIDGRGRIVRQTGPRAHEAGTPNAVGAVALAAAMVALEGHGLREGRIERAERELSIRAWEGLCQIPGLRLVSEYGAPVLTFTLEDRRPEEVAEELSRRFGIGVRAGSFCVYEGVRRLLGIGRKRDRWIAARVAGGDKTAIPGLVRASLNFLNTPGEVDQLIDALRKIGGGR